MEKNASGTRRQTLRASTERCPVWCVKHDSYDEDTPDAVLVHRGKTRRTVGYTLQLRRDDLVRTGHPGRARLNLDGAELTAEQGRRLADVLAETAGELS